MKPKVFMMISALLLVSDPTAYVQVDITSPGDPMIGIPNDGVTQNVDHGWPEAEAPPKAIDNIINVDTQAYKFLHFKGDVEPTGIAVTPLGIDDCDGY